MASTHQAALETKHATLDKRLTEESGRPQPDMTLIVDLKKQKLRLKEEIGRD